MVWIEVYLLNIPRVVPNSSYSPCFRDSSLVNDTRARLGDKKKAFF